MKNKKCPRCGSSKIKIIDYIGVKCIVCKNCGYDETSFYEVYPEQKKSKKEKAGYSTYKTGGPKRAGK